MEIRFCSICNESIPDGEFDAGRAVIAGKRSQHVACALRRGAAVTGFRSWFTFGLALLAAGISVALLVDRLGASDDPPAMTEVPPVVRAHVAEAVAASEKRADDALAEAKAALTSSFESTLRTRLAEQGTEVKKTAADAMERMLRTTGDSLDRRFRSLEDMSTRLQQRMAEIVAWKRRIQREADQLRADLEAQRKRQPSALPPEPKKPAQPEEAAPKKPAGPTAEDQAREKEIDRWIKRLKDPDEEIVFSATITLARLHALRAASALVEVLQKHKDYYARLGAATALDELKATSAVPALIEALNDKDDLVRSEANQALEHITDQTFHFASGMTRAERQRIQKHWREWWKANADAVRRRLGQVEKVEGPGK